MAVVEEGGDRASARQPHEIRLRRVDRLGGLPWRQDGVAHASLGGQIERLQIDSGLSEPHALRWMTEAVGEIGQSPVNLRAFIARRGKGQDGVVVRLRQRVAGAVAFVVAPVGIHDALVYIGMMRFEPVRQRGAEIEADALKDARRRVGAIAFGSDLLVEVVVVTGARLMGHLSSERIFARRLVEVSVDTEILACHCHSSVKPSGNDHFVGTRPALGTSVVHVGVDTSRPTGSLWNCSTIAAYCTAVCLNSRRRVYS